MPQQSKKKLAPLAHDVNRELSWLAFNQRVLMEADNVDNPVFERMKFLSIVSSNLDEFFMIRVAGLRELCNAGVKRADEAGLSPKQQLERVMPRIQRMMYDQYEMLNQRIVPELADCGVRLLPHSVLGDERAAWADGFFVREVYPILTPMAVDANRPFPHILNRSLNLALLLAPKHGEAPDFATVQVPAGLPRAILLPRENGGRTMDFLLLEDLIAHNLHRLFTGRRVLACAPYRITRSGDFPVDEEDAVDILAEVEKTVKKRKWGAVIRLEVGKGADEELVRLLRHALKTTRDELYLIDGPISLDFLMKQIYPMDGYGKYRFAPFLPHVPKDLAEGDADSLFAAIARRDILLHHPYDSFNPVVEFIQEAARDPKVLAIKQTLYRVSGHSPIVRALAEAAEAGKQVTVLLEIKARFDEENNIQWGKRLERAGCHVVYGLRGLKVHAKMTLVVRREEAGIRRYVHLATGNYNDVTANLYTDMGLFTAKPEVGEDAAAIFNLLSGYSEAPALHRLIYAPEMLRTAIIGRIQREEQYALGGRPAGISVKINALIDHEVAEALCSASRAGVRIRLLVRGVCCVRPGVPQCSEHIEVHSIVGRFLEHSRIFWFVNGGQDEIYLSSADWMTRNLDRRVELMFPIEDALLQARVRSIFEQSWHDTQKTWIMDAKANYRRIAPAPDQTRLDVQQALILEATKKQSLCLCSGQVSQPSATFDDKQRQENLCVHQGLNEEHRHADIDLSGEEMTHDQRGRDWEQPHVYAVKQHGVSCIAAGAQQKEANDVDCVGGEEAQQQIDQVFR